MNTAKTLLALVALVPAFAGAQTIDQRLHEQHERIVQGVRSGELTRRETRTLDRRDAIVRAQERVDRRFDGGHLTYGERRGIERELNREGRAINRDKHGCRRPY